MTPVALSIVACAVIPVEPSGVIDPVEVGTVKVTAVALLFPMVAREVVLLTVLYTVIVSFLPPHPEFDALAVGADLVSTPDNVIVSTLK
jgi:hypothetical protein